MIISWPWVNSFVSQTPEMCQKEGRLSSIPRISLRNCRQTIVKLLISAVQFWTCADEFCITLATPLAGISIYSPSAHRAHTWAPSMWCGFVRHCFLPLQWAVKLWCRESYIIALQRSVTCRENLFFYCKMGHSGLQLCCCETPCTRLSINHKSFSGQWESFWFGISVVLSWIF